MRSSNFRLLISIWRRLFVLRGLAAASHKLPFVESSLRYLRGIHERWSAFRPEWRGIVVGVTFMLGSSALNDLAIFRKADDSALDWMVSIHRGVPRLGHNAIGPKALRPVAFLDIDERSYRYWGEPLFVPREKLQRLIEHAVNSGASLVVVDVELSQTTGTGDSTLSAYFASLGNTGAEVPPIILVKGLRTQLGCDQCPMEQRPSFLDATVATSPYLHWAAPLFDVDDDGVIRRWRLWQKTSRLETNSDKSQQEWLPSIQWLAVNLLCNSGVKHTAKYSGPMTPASACTSGAEEKSNPRTGKTQEHLKDNVDDKLARRVLYTIPWSLREGETFPSWMGKEPTGGKLFTVKPAVLVTENSPRIDPEMQGRVVFIGASFTDSRDAFATPLGIMPGTVVLANAYLSLAQSGEARENPKWKYGLEALLIVLLAVLFARLPGLVAKLLGTMVTLAILLPASLYLYKSGVWLDFAIPLIAVEFHAVLEGIDEKLRHHYQNP